jgi:hypothetical protein
VNKTLTKVSCNCCDYNITTPQLNGWLVFLYNGVEVPLRKTLGWCTHCHGLVSAEQLRDSELIIQEMSELAKQLSVIEKTLKTNYWQRLLNRKLRRVRRRSVETLLSLAAELDIARQRNNQAKCISCGGFNVQVIEANIHIGEQFWQQSKHKSLATGLVHPVCGGEFIASEQIQSQAPLSQAANYQYISTTNRSA